MDGRRNHDQSNPVMNKQNAKMRPRYVSTESPRSSVSSDSLHNDKLNGYGDSSVSQHGDVNGEGISEGTADLSEEGENENVIENESMCLLDSSRNPPRPICVIPSPVVDHPPNLKMVPVDPHNDRANNSTSNNLAKPHYDGYNEAAFIPHPDRPFLPFSELSHTETKPLKPYRLNHVSNGEPGSPRIPEIQPLEPVRHFSQDMLQKQGLQRANFNTKISTQQPPSFNGDGESSYQEYWSSSKSPASASSQSRKPSRKLSRNNLSASNAKSSKVEKETRRRPYRSNLINFDQNTLASNSTTDSELERSSIAADDWVSGSQFAASSAPSPSLESNHHELHATYPESKQSLERVDPPVIARAATSPVYRFGQSREPSFEPGYDGARHIQHRDFSTPQWRETYDEYNVIRQPLYDVHIMATPPDPNRSQRASPIVPPYVDPLYAQQQQHTHQPPKHSTPRQSQPQHLQQSQQRLTPLLEMQHHSVSMRGEQVQAMLEIQGNLLDMTRDWSLQETKCGRRLVKFERVQHGVVVYLSFEPIDPADYRENMCVISCIWRRETHEYFVTSVDCIALLELIINQRFSVEEKNRIRRNLEVCKPITVSKSKPELEMFFRQIMSFTQPRPRNIEKDVKVFLWGNLENALKKIVSKYSASWSALNS